MMINDDNKNSCLALTEPVAVRNLGMRDGEAECISTF